MFIFIQIYNNLSRSLSHPHTHTHPHPHPHPPPFNEYYLALMSDHLYEKHSLESFVPLLVDRVIGQSYPLGMRLGSS